MQSAPAKSAVHAHGQNGLVRQAGLDKLQQLYGLLTREREREEEREFRAAYH